MKVLRLLRHAKSSWDFPELSDFERPLNKRGERDAPTMGERLQQKLNLPEVIVSSPALRAITTAKVVAEKIGLGVDAVKPLARIYGGGITTLIGVIHNLNDMWDSVMLVGHNPYFTYLANELAGSEIENIPTAGLVTIEFDIDSWQDVSPGSGKQLDFDYPKKN